MMSQRLWTLVALAAILLIGPVGCKDEATEMSKADTLLADQHEVWEGARETLHSGQPNLEMLRSVSMYIGGRTLKRVKKDYTGANKEEVIAKLEELKKAYEEKVASKVTMRSPMLQLKPGVTLEDVRKAFDELDGEYRAFQALTAPKK